MILTGACWCVVYAKLSMANCYALKCQVMIAAVSIDAAINIKNERFILSERQLYLQLYSNMQIYRFNSFINVGNTYTYGE
jgi:hypothetical protein